MNIAHESVTPPWCALEVHRLLEMGYRLCANPECPNLTAGDPYCADCSDQRGSQPNQILTGLMWALAFEAFGAALGYIIFCFIKG